MGIFDALHGAVDGLRDLPGVRRARRAAYERRFRDAREAHLFHGVYPSFDAAARAAPKTAPLGYDDAGAAELYVGRLAPDVHDYPAFFWLRDAIATGARRVADLGGNVGLKFHALGSLVPLPADLVWTVVDVPAVVARGRELLGGGPGPAGGATLVFAGALAELAAIDVVYVSGTLQYLPQTLDRLLAEAPAPARIVVNTTPLHPSRSYFTLNSIGRAYCPYRVQAEPEFLAAMEAAGYRVRDRWRNVGKGLAIPFERGLDVDAYSGVCFDRQPIA